MRLYSFIKRDLRRAALFLWMTPLAAARSSALSAFSIASTLGLPLSIVARAFLTYVRVDERTTRLRTRRRSELRIRLIADLVFANDSYPLNLR